jgi:glycerol-3-phosphate dehydrogenase (NAD(P)+)
VSQQVRSVAILGAGKLAEAMAQLLVPAASQVRMWARQREQAKRAAHGATVVESIAQACDGADLVCFAVPVPALAEVAHAAGAVARGDQIALHACRGVVVDENVSTRDHATAAHGSLLWPHQIIRQQTCIKKIVALGGPLYVEDAQQGRPLVAVAASGFDECLRALSGLVASTRVRLHGSRDVIGVEVAGAVSNVSIIAAGIAHGAGLGDTDQGILLTRGLHEAQLVGQALGAEAATFAGLAGVGDLVPRKVSSTRRHRELGEAIGRGHATDQPTAAHADLEGPRTARALADLAERLHLDLPLISAVRAVLDGKQEPRAALERVLSLDLDLGA